jgi:hypothetical protein
MICLVQLLYWEANRKHKDRFLTCEKCPFRGKCRDEAREVSA